MELPEIHGGAFAGISKALGSSKKPAPKSTPDAPKSPSKPAGFYSGASYKMAHAAIPPISGAKPPEPKADIETPSSDSARSEAGQPGGQDA